MEENKPKKIEVETYAEDMAGAMEGGDAGIVKKIIKEQGAYEEAQKEVSPESIKNKIYLYLGIVFTLLAVGIVVYLLANRESLGTVTVQTQFTPMIFLDETAFVKVDGLLKPEIVKDTKDEINSGDIKYGGVKGVYLTEGDKIIGLSRFLGLIEAGVPKEKLPLFSEEFLIGRVEQNDKETFILLQAKSFAEVFNEMRAWEKKMFTDLRGFFDIDLATANQYLITKSFEDGIIENKNARILYDNEANILLMYVFVDENSIVVANTEEAVREVMLRLSASKIKK